MTVARHRHRAGSAEGRYIAWLTIADNAKSVVEDVARTRNHPLVKSPYPSTATSTT